MSLDASLGFDFLPDFPAEAAAPDADPRAEITLRHVLNMSSGLQTVDNGGLEYAVGSGMSYWAGASSVGRRPAPRPDPRARDELGLRELRHPARRLRDEARPGQREEVSRVPTPSPARPHRHAEHPPQHRPLRRLHPQQSGLHQRPRPRPLRPPLPPERPLERRESPIRRLDRVRPHPSPATHNRGNFYGGQFWLVPDERTDVPRDAYSTAGNRGQFVVIAPSHDLVIVRRGLDYGRQGFDRWDMTREVIKAFPAAAAAAD